MISQIFYIYGFSLLLLSKVFAVYWNETDFVNVDARDSRRIRNKFLTFDTTDTDIELAFQFNVPFVAVPADRSLSNINNSIASFANLNLGSVALAGAMILVGSLSSFVWTTFIPKFSTTFITNDDNNTATTTTTPATPATNIDDSTTTTNIDDSTTTVDDNNNTGNKIPKADKANEDNKFTNFMNLLEATINPTVCIQQYICALSKLSAKNVAEGCEGCSTDKIIVGIFETRWILDMIAGSAIHDAIQFGESTGDCHKKFSKCGFGNMDSEMFELFMRSVNVIK